MFPGVLQESMLKRATDKGLLSFALYDIRAFAENKHHQADDYPFGGGQGMLLMPQPIFDCMAQAEREGTGRARRIYLSPKGTRLTTKVAQRLAQEDELILLCGHYEGVDQRVLDFWNMEEVSIGDYILTGGELPAMVLIDAVARFIPDVLGSQESIADESIYSGLLECDQYTKPRNFEGMDVPEVLLSGNHKMIHLWQYENALRLTKERRPDLFLTYLEKEKELSKDEKKILEKVVSKPL